DPIGRRHPGACGEHAKALLSPEAIQGDGHAVPQEALLRVGGSRRRLGNRVFDDLAPSVGATRRTYAVRQPRAMAARTPVQACLASLMIGPSLIATRTGGSLLRDG